MPSNQINIIAEIGWNHMGDMNLAEKMIVSAARNGADICKFQTWSVKNIKPGPWDTDGRKEIYKKAELSKEQHYYLKEICENNNVSFLTSIFNINDIDFLSSLIPSMIKIPSHEIGNFNLVRSVVDRFNKIIISTGASKWQEVLKIANELNKQKIIFMHCVSTYPCPFDKINLKRIIKLKELTNVGYSGHLQGIEDSVAAICLGAVFVEKHFTIDTSLPGRDNKFAITPKQLNELSDFREKYIKMTIDHGLDLQDSERDTYDNYRGRCNKK